MNTRVQRTKRFEKDLDKVGLVEAVGVREVRKRPGYHDEPLRGWRKGQRSVRLNQAYRLIYREVRDHLEILLLEVSKHEY